MKKQVSRKWVNIYMVVFSQLIVNIIPRAPVMRTKYILLTVLVYHGPLQSHEFWEQLSRTENLQMYFNKPCDLSALQHCNNSGADAMIFLNLAPHAAGQGHQTAYVRTVDSDSMVYAMLASSHHLDCQSFGGFL